MNKTLKDIAGLVIEYLNIAIYLIIGLAIVTFVWNVYRYFFTEKDKTEAGLYVMYSVIGFFVILSFWGLVAILRNSLKLNDRAPSFPGFNQGSSRSPATGPYSDFGIGYKPDANIFNTNASNQAPTAPGGSFPSVNTNSNYDSSVYYGNTPTPLPGATTQPK
ncbi:MAG: pilin [Patescibacteria group bacterium]